MGIILFQCFAWDFSGWNGGEREWSLNSDDKAYIRYLNLLVLKPR